MPFKNYVENDQSLMMEPKNQLARAYVPFQVLGDIFNPKEALCKGTLFPKLWMPYQPYK